MTTSGPKFSIVTPVYDPPADRMDACIASVLGQSFDDWEWCLVDDCSTRADVVPRLRELAASDSRIKLVCRSQNGGIVAASNDALGVAVGEWVVLLDHDDELTPDALSTFCNVLNETNDVDFMYSDEEVREETGRLIDTFEKPAWSPGRLRSQMYTGHLTAYRRSVINQVGGFRDEFNGSQDYDLALRVSEVSRRILHVPKVLYRWVAGPASVVNNAGAKTWAFDAGIRAVQAHCDRVGIMATVSATSIPGVHRLDATESSSELVSIIIPTRGDVGVAHGLRQSFVLRCIESIMERSTYSNFEVVCVYDTATDGNVLSHLRALESERVRLIEFDEPFSFSRKSNLGAFHARGNRLIFLNDDTEVITSGWIEALLRPIEEGDVGMVGARLLFEDGTLQHAGQFMKDIPDHVLYRVPGDLPGPMSIARVERECEGVTAACALIRRDVFEFVGGFSEDLANNYNDVDLCLKVRELDLRIIWTPFAELWHFESSSRDASVSGYEHEFMARRWSHRMHADPYFVPSITNPPREWTPPLFR